MGRGLTIEDQGGLNLVPMKERVKVAGKVQKRRANKGKEAMVVQVVTERVGQDVVTPTEWVASGLLKMLLAMPRGLGACAPQIESLSCPTHPAVSVALGAVATAVVVEAIVGRGKAGDSVGPLMPTLLRTVQTPCPVTQLNLGSPSVVTSCDPRKKHRQPPQRMQQQQQQQLLMAPLPPLTPPLLNPVLRGSRVMVPLVALHIAAVAVEVEVVAVGEVVDVEAAAVNGMRLRAMKNPNSPQILGGGPYWRRGKLRR